MVYQNDGIVGMKKREAATKATQMKTLLDKLMLLENKRIALEQKYVESVMQEYYANDTEIAIEIEKKLQEQKRTLINIYDLDDGEKFGDAWPELNEWRKYHEKYRLLPNGYGQFYDVEYCKIPERYKEFELFNLLTASSIMLGPLRVSIGMPFNEIDEDTTFLAVHDFTPIVALVEDLEDGKAKYPFIWSVDAHEPVYYSAIQVRSFVIPELRNLRHKTKSIYLKQLINYFTVFMRKAKEPLGVYIS